MPRLALSKQYLLLGYTTYFLLSVLSVLYYKERTVFIDIAFHLFQILKDGTFAIQNNRFVAFVTQLIPLTGSSLQLSLSNIALLYSLSFTLLHFTTFAIIGQLLKNIKVAVAFLLFSVLMTTHTFFWIQSELPQGVAFLFIFIALFDNILHKDKIPEYFILAATILLVTITFSHPLILFACLFLFVFYYLSFPGKRKFIVYSGITYLTLYLLRV